MGVSKEWLEWDPPLEGESYSELPVPTENSEKITNWHYSYSYNSAVPAEKITYYTDYSEPGILGWIFAFLQWPVAIFIIFVVLSELYQRSISNHQQPKKQGRGRVKARENVLYRPQGENQSQHRYQRSQQCYAQNFAGERSRPQGDNQSQHRYQRMRSQQCYEQNFTGARNSQMGSNSYPANHYPGSNSSAISPSQYDHDQRQFQNHHQYRSDFQNSNARNNNNGLGGYGTGIKRNYSTGFTYQPVFMRPPQSQGMCLNNDPYQYMFNGNIGRPYQRCQNQPINGSPANGHYNSYNQANLQNNNNNYSRTFTLPQQPY